MCAGEFGRAASRREAAFAAAHRMCATAARAMPRRALASEVAHKVCALAWTAVLSVVFAWVLFIWLLVWPLGLTVELIFRVVLAARVRMLHDRKAHVPASLRVQTRSRLVPCTALAASSCSALPDARTCSVNRRG